MTLRARRLLLIALIAWLVGTLLVIMMGPVSIPALEQRLETNAQNALSDREHDWAQVSLKGQVATLTGAAPSSTERNDAIFTVLHSTWSGGVVAGGITRVIDETGIARVERGFAFRADLLNGRVTIRGDASDAGARDSIASFASANFPAGAETDLTLIPGGASSPQWEEAAKRLLGQLARLDRGAIVLTGEQGGLIGDAANPQIAQSVSNALATMPAPFVASAVVTPAGAPSVIRIEDALACHAVVRAAQGGHELRFDQNGVRPNPLSELAMRRVGTIFRECPAGTHLALSVLVGPGDEELAAQRAAVVRALLVEGGSDETRIDVMLASDQLSVISFAVTQDEG